MFSSHNFEGKAIDRELALLRARIEPIVEITQIKGTSESHSYLSPDDDFSMFEFDWFDPSISYLESGQTFSEKSALAAGSFAREALAGFLHSGSASYVCSPSHIPPPQMRVLRF